MGVIAPNQTPPPTFPHPYTTQNPLEKDFNDYQKLVIVGLDQQRALKSCVFDQFHQQVSKIILIRKTSGNNTA